MIESKKENMPMTCDRCGKKECADCVKENGMNFCCANCCADYKTQQKQPAKEPINVCKYC